MRLLWSEPYLWIHVAGLAALPLALELCLLGLAVGDPILPVWLEILLVALVGVGPILWMQIQRPFYIFSLLIIALTPEQLNQNQQRILRLFKASSARIWALVTAIAAVVILVQLYNLAPIAAEVNPLSSGGRPLGLVVAVVGFFASNLFLQVPVSVLRILLQTDAQFLATEPYPLAQIRQDFTIPGFQVNQILPPLEPTAPANRQATPQGNPSANATGVVSQTDLDLPTK